MKGLTRGEIGRLVGLVLASTIVMAGVVFVVNVPLFGPWAAVGGALLLVLGLIAAVVLFRRGPILRKTLKSR